MLNFNSTNMFTYNVFCYIINISYKTNLSSHLSVFVINPNFKYYIIRRLFIENSILE